MGWEADSVITKPTPKVKEPKRTWKNDPTIETDEMTFDLPKGAGFGQFIAGVGELIDRFGAAPTREAFIAQLKAKKEGRSQFTQDWEGVKAFAKQFAKGFRPEMSPSIATTGKEIAIEGGVSDIPQKGRLWMSKTPADVMGFFLNMGLDISNLIPVSTGSKIVLKTARKGAPIAGAVTGVGTEAITGMKKPRQVIETLGDVYKETEEAVKTITKTEALPDYQKMVKIAKKAGIPENELPQAVKYGKESGLSMAERAKAESPFGEQLREQFEKGMDRLQQGVRDEITKTGRPLIKSKAGDYLVDTYNNTMKKFFDQFDVTNQKIIKEIPGLKLSKRAVTDLMKRMNGIEMAATKMAKSANKQLRSQGEEILRSLDAVDKTNLTYKQIYEQLADVGRIAFMKPAVGTIPPDKRVYMKLYGHLKDALHKTIADDVPGGKLLLKELKENNKIISKLYKDKDALGSYLGKDIASEKAFKGVLSDTKHIKALKGILEPAEMKVLKASYLKDLMKESLEGDFFSMKQFGKRLKDKEDIIGELFEPAELTTIRNYIKLADRYGLKLLSQSQTGASQAFLRILKDVPIRTAERFVLKPLEIAAKQRATGKVMSPIAPMLFTPIQYAKGTKPRLKAGQVYSVQREQNMREQEDEFLIGLYGLGVNKWDVSKKKRVLKLMELLNKSEDDKMKFLRKRELKKLTGGQ